MPPSPLLSPQFHLSGTRCSQISPQHYMTSAVDHNLRANNIHLIIAPHQIMCQEQGLNKQNCKTAAIMGSCYSLCQHFNSASKTFKALFSKKQYRSVSTSNPGVVYLWHQWTLLGAYLSKALRLVPLLYSPLLDDNHWRPACATWQLF